METFVRVETSEGRSAIAVVSVWGHRAVEVVDAIFRPARGKPLADTPTGRLRLGRAGPGAGDEIVAVRLETATPTVELQCHGGYEAVRALVSALEQAGAKPCEVDEFKCPSSLVDDPLASQALADLPHAPTVRVAEILLDQAQGALRLELARIGHVLPMGTGPTLERLERLIGRAALGLRLLDGWKVVISGRPNVGKSRLFNALAGYARAIVDPTPGVTRDVITVRTAFRGWPVELSDTAGLREAEDSIERLGIARTRREQEGADLVLLVLDRSEPLLASDRDLIGSTAGALLVANKSDLPPAWKPDEAILGSSDMVSVSAESGAGLADLMAAIIARLVPDPPRPGEPVPFRPDHLARLVQAHRDLKSGHRQAALDSLAAIGPDRSG